MRKVPVDRERLTMVVIIGRIVAETSFRRNVGIGSRSHRLLGKACKSLAISSIDSGGNDASTLGGRGDWSEDWNEPKYQITCVNYTALYDHSLLQPYIA